MAVAHKALTGRILAACVSLLLLGGVFAELTFAMEPDRIEWPVVIADLYVAGMTVVFAVVSYAILSRYPRHPVGWALGTLTMVAAISFYAKAHLLWPDLPLGAGVLWVWRVSNTLIFVLLAIALLLFPDGRLPSGRWRWVLYLCFLYIGISLLVEGLASWTSDIRYLANPIGIPSQALSKIERSMFVGEPGLLPLASVPLVIIAASSVWWRWRGSVGVIRRQMMWMLLAALVFATEASLAVVYSLGIAPELLGDPRVESAGGLPVGNLIFVLSIGAIPVALGLGVVRYRLYDIDRLLSRTLSYGVLTVSILAVYGVAVSLAGQLIGSTAEFTTTLGLLVTALVALVFHPLRRTLEGRADRIVYGPKADQVELMVRVGRQLAATLDVEDILVATAEAAASGTRATQASASLVLSDGQVILARWGQTDAAANKSASVPIDYLGTHLGEIAVTDPAHRADTQEVLSALARVSSIALHHVRLLAELDAIHRRLASQNRQLEASKDRLQAAELAERRRLEAKVSSVILPSIAFIRDVSSHIPMDAGTDPRTAIDDLDSLVLRANRLIGDIRSLSRGILPAVLTDHGLVAAMRALIRRLEVDTRLEIHPSELPDCDQNDEVAAYMCCRAFLEAADPVGGGEVMVRLGADGENLTFSIAGSGPGLKSRVDDELERDRIESRGGRLKITHTKDGWLVSGWVPGAGSTRPVGTADRGVLELAVTRLE